MGHKKNAYGRKLDEIERCYREYTPPQIQQQKAKPNRKGKKS